MTAQFIKGKAVTTFNKTFQPFSEIQCVKKCYEAGKEDMCSVAGYNKTTKACYTNVDTQQDVVDVADEMSGVFFMTDGEYSMRWMGGALRIVRNR